jgi:hypothetical protein
MYQFAIQNSVDVCNLKAWTVILDHFIRVQHIRPHLVPPCVFAELQRLVECSGCFFSFLLLLVSYLGEKKFQRVFLVRMLRPITCVSGGGGVIYVWQINWIESVPISPQKGIPVILTLGNKACWQMCDSYSGIGCVDVLPSCTRGFEGVYKQKK